MSDLFLLLFEFFKIGLFAVGGGLATIPFLMELASRYTWFSADTLTTMIAVSESTPGPLGVNMATYVGFSAADIVGAIIATLSLVAPSIIIICIIANYLQKFKDSRIVKMIFAGLKPAVVAFIISACLSIFRAAILLDGFSWNWNIFAMLNFTNIAILIIMLIINHYRPKIHPIAYIVGAACIGILFSL